MRETRIRNRNPEYKMGIYQAYRYNLEFDNRCIDNPEDLPKQYNFGTEAAVRKLRFKKIKREIVG